MTTARADQSATLLNNGQVLVAGGLNSHGNDLVLVTAGVQTRGLFSELYTPATGHWSPATGGLNNCGSVSECFFGSSATLLGTGEVLVAGGLTGLNSNPRTTASAMLYNPVTNAWTSTGPMSGNRANQTATLLPGGQVLIAGGGQLRQPQGHPARERRALHPLVARHSRLN